MHWCCFQQHQQQPMGAATALLRSISSAKKKKMKYFLDRIYLPKPKPSIVGQELVDSFVDYELMETKDAANEWAIAAMRDLQDSIELSQEKVLAGVDVGWNRHAKKPLRAATHILHVSLPGRPVGVFHLRAMKVNDELDFPEQLRNLLHLPNLLGCGLGINRDLARLKRKMGVHVPLRVELDKLLKILDRKQECTMQYMCQRYLDREIDPTIGMKVDYAEDPLPLRLIRHGALEALHSRLLAEVMTHEALKLPPVEPAPELEVGTKVKVFTAHGRKPAADGVIVYVGGRYGESVQFGDTMVNKGRALVRLTALENPHSVAMFGFSAGLQAIYGGMRAVTLGRIFASENPVLATTMTKLRAAVHWDDEKNVRV